MQPESTLRALSGEAEERFVMGARLVYWKQSQAEQAVMGLINQAGQQSLMDKVTKIK